MDSKKKRLAKNTILLYCRTIITMILGLYTSRVVLQVLGVDDFGTYNVVGGFVAMFTMISGALTFSTQRFLTFELGKKEGDVRTIFSAAINIHLLLILLFFIVSETIGLWFINTHLQFPADRMNSVNLVFQFSVITFSLNLWSIPYSATIIAHERMDIFAYVTIFEALAKLICIYIVSYLSFDRLVAWGAGLLSIAIIIRIFYTIFCSRCYDECHYKRVKDKKVYSQMLSFAGWNFLGTIADTFNDQGVNMLSNMFFGVQVNAARGVTTQVSSATRSFVNNFTTALNPQIVKSYARKDYHYLNTLIFYGSKISFFLLLLIVVPLFIEIDEVLKLWLVTPPLNTSTFIRISLFYLLTLSLMNAPITAMFATGNLKKSQMMSAVMLFANFIVTYVLFKLGLPAYVSYISMAITSFIILIFRVLILKDLITFDYKQYFSNVIGRSVLVLCLAFVIPYGITLYLQTSIVRLLLVIVISLFTNSTIIFYIGLNRMERQRVLQVVKSKLTKRQNG